MIQCKEVSEEVNNYIDGELSLYKRISLFFHFVFCHCCRNYLQQIRRTITTISIMKPKEKISTNIESLAQKLHYLYHKNN